MLRVLMALALAGAVTGVAAGDDFSGQWQVTRVVESKRDGFPWAQEIKYPKAFTLALRNGRLEGSYVDQWGNAGTFELVAVINKGHDLLLVHGGAGTKSPEALAPIHHIKLEDGALHAVVTSHDKLFEWFADRK